MTEKKPEIDALNEAYNKVHDKINWHKQQIEDLTKQIKDNENTINELKGILRSKFDYDGKKQRRTYGEGSSTGDLIAVCLKASLKPLNIKQLVDYLKEHGNNTNPSVELSRMIKKGLVRRASRGYYEWI